MSVPTEADLNVSLEPHLLDTLSEVASLLPGELSIELRQTLERVRPGSQDASRAAATSSVYTGPLISYALLSRISQWTRGAHGQQALAEHGLEPSRYNMVSLLAGTRTSPERKFPAASAPPVDSASKELSDRRAVTALLNALLSIVGAGVAVWWAADTLRWKDEWVSRSNLAER